MKAKPEGRDLLAIALETLTKDLIPGLSGSDRYSALMIANALGTLDRELADEGETEILSGRLLGAAYGEDRGRGLDHIAQDIRAGRFDDREDIGALLLLMAKARCTLSNPKAAATYTD